jgi:ABC-2 type transport system ATP-binding protein
MFRQPLRRASVLPGSFIAMHAVEIQHVTKTFARHTAVNDLSLTVPVGSIYGFIGPNGSGKTTTLRMIMRIFHPDSGRIRVLGAEALDAANDRVGYLPEERGLYKKMKVREVLRFLAELKNGKNIASEIDAWLSRMQLSESANKPVETLSKGMAQKVQFIAAVITKPELVLLDEPFSGLDPVNAEVLKDAVLDLRRQGATVIFSTHDMDVAERMCDFVFMIHQGRKVLDGTLGQIQSQYGTDVIRVRLEPTGEAEREAAKTGPGLHDRLAGIAGVERVNDFGQLQELRIASGTDTQQMLNVLMQLGAVRHFELAKPSLHDIFVRIARPEANEAAATEAANEPA